MGEKIYRLFSASPFCVFGGFLKKKHSVVLGVFYFWFKKKTMPLSQLNYSLLCFYLYLDAIRPDLYIFSPSTVAPAGYIYH